MTDWTKNRVIWGLLTDLLWVVHVGPGERAFFVFIAVFAVLFAIPVILLIEETFE